MKIEKKIDVPKLKARIKELEAEIKAGKLECKRKQREFSKKCNGLSPYDSRCDASWRDIPCSSPKEYVSSERYEVNRLYALRAHLRDKLHIRKTKKVDDNGNVTYEEWDMERQYNLIVYDISDYLAQPEVEQV